MTSICGTTHSKFDHNCLCVDAGYEIDSLDIARCRSRVTNLDARVKPSIHARETKNRLTLVDVRENIIIEVWGSKTFPRLTSLEASSEDLRRI